MTEPTASPCAQGRPTIVVTSIFKPSPALHEIATGACAAGYHLIVIGDSSSPPDFELPHCDYYELDRQCDIGFRYAEVCPIQHYAQRIAWENGWNILYREPDVSQERNPHNLMRDFRDEIPGYLQNRTMCATLEELELKNGSEHLPENLRASYAALVRGGWVRKDELDLLEAWLGDVCSVMRS